MMANMKAKTPKHLSELTGIPLYNISRYMAGKRVPIDAHCRLMSKYLGCEWWQVREDAPKYITRALGREK